jgi:hypothetical protein
LLNGKDFANFGLEAYNQNQRQTKSMDNNKRKRKSDKPPTREEELIRE